MKFLQNVGRSIAQTVKLQRVSSLLRRLISKNATKNVLQSQQVTMLLPLKPSVQVLNLASCICWARDQPEVVLTVGRKYPGRKSQTGAIVANREVQLQIMNLSDLNRAKVLTTIGRHMHLT